jgi:hypothetical protein
MTDVLQRITSIGPMPRSNSEASAKHVTGADDARARLLEQVEELALLRGEDL